MSWLPHGTSPTGLVFSDGKGRSASVPALATYRGRLWCLWTDFAGQIWYAQTDTDDSGDAAQFGTPQQFPQSGMPVMANLNGVLHVVVRRGSGALAHFVHDDDDPAVAWTDLGALDASAGLVAHSTPALVAFHNKLFLAFLRDGRLYYSIWAELGTDARRWTPPALVADARLAFRGIPALFVVDSTLHVLCGADTDDRHILGFRFDYIAQAWTQSDDVSEGRAASGVSAVSFGRSAYLGIIEAGPGDDTHAVHVAALNDGVWGTHEPLGGTATATAADPPQMAILNGRVHCLFNDNTDARDLRWYSRPVLPYALASWMAGLDDALRLCDLTIPGTHDTCARSGIPFVRTQYLSVPQQLALGIRFLDLRLRAHKDGRLYCYHGGIPIGMPRYLSFDAVMDSVWAFFAAHPSETVLVSIDNDDRSDAQEADPAPFYATVAAAVADTRRWHTGPLTPTLGDVRGKAVLLRRYAGDPATPPTARIGLDLSAWLDDNPDFTIVTPTEVRVRLQDKWKFARRIALHDLVDTKAAYVQALMDAAETRAADADGNTHDWYLNFCSAVGDPAEHGEVAEAKWIAVGAHSSLFGKWVPGMNVVTSAYLQAHHAHGRARLGIVNLDYPELPEDSDVVARLIETNF